ncbi:MAG: helix-turn-helix transcriptional regulator [Pseudomonadota bacterium]
MMMRDRLIRLCKVREQLGRSDPNESSIYVVARDAAMSRFHFVRQFKAVFGEAPVQYRMRARLNNAKQLLLNSDQSVTDICMAVGFSSLGSFNSLFAKHFGHAPSAYRQKFSGQVEAHSPHCMTLLRAAWIQQSQNSRNQRLSE